MQESNPKRETMFTKLVTISALIIFFFAISVRSEDLWRPNPKFSIEGSSYTETLTFISGMAYAISYNDKELAKKNLPNYFCVPNDTSIDSRLLIEIANEKLEGDHTSEGVTRPLVFRLQRLSLVSARVSTYADNADRLSNHSKAQLPLLTK